MTEHVSAPHAIDLRGIPLLGSILDVGGGGEGVISQHAGGRVVAIDRFREELEETPDIGLKIVMDARDMGFLDRTFDNVTCFYTLMYMDEPSVRRFAREAHRVAKPGGRLWIWDARIPTLAEGDVFVAQIEARIDGGEVIRAGYGVGWNRAQDIDVVMDIMRDAGFDVEGREDRVEGFALCLRRA